MHWHILGAGSIGCLWAAHLAEAGHDVTLILRSEQRIASFAGHITLEQDGHCTQHTVHCELAGSPAPIENLLVTTKAYDVAAALASVQHRFTNHSQLVLMHNGMGPQQAAHQQFSTLPVWAASTTDGAWQRAPGHVVFAGHGETRIGRLGQTDDRSLPDQLQTLRLAINADPEIEQSLWRKLAINCAINPLTAEHNCRNGELVDNPALHRQMASICEEIEQLLTAMKLPLFDKGVLAAASEVARATGLNYSSMQQDVQHGRQTEIDYITGYLCQQAENSGISLPENERLLRNLKKNR